MDYNLRSRVDQCLEVVKRLLDWNRVPTLAEDTPHSYQDKYLLAEALTHSAIAALVNVLGVGFNMDRLQVERLVGLAKEGKSVTLRFCAEEKCAFEKEETVYVDSATQHVVEGGMFGRVTSKTVTKQQYFYWKHTIDYKLIVFVGSDPKNNPTVLLQRSDDTLSKTMVKQLPKKEVVVKDPVDVNLSWMLRQLDSKLQPLFKIDRLNNLCKTPRRNPQVENALSFFSSVSTFFTRLRSYFLDEVFPIQREHNLDLSALSAFALFVPVLPYYVSKKHNDTEMKEIAPSSNMLVSRIKRAIMLAEESTQGKELLVAEENESLLNEHIRVLLEKSKDIEKVFTLKKGFITDYEAKFMAFSHHVMLLAAQYVDCIEYIELMLRKQLVSAIGKELNASDFYKYMQFHSRKIFQNQYSPKPFCFAVRRPDHFPEGVLSFEALQSGDTISEPIQTFVHRTEATDAMQFSINAATKVSFFGSRYLHLWMAHQFFDESMLKASLNARARQFSSFIILVGNIGSSTLFLPKFGLIVQNKDDLKIPLELERIPTAKEFKEAISSLSKEQQEFAKAYRSMQLESTMFGVVILQIKPQLEKLLNLPFDSLTKEIELTQDLMELFIKYQIPSDLLSYSTEDNVIDSQKSKIQFVQNQVKSMKAMLKSAKEKEIEDRRDEARYNQPTKRFAVAEEHYYEDEACDYAPEMSLASAAPHGRAKKAFGKAASIFSRFGSSNLSYAPGPAYAPTPAGYAPTSPSYYPTESSYSPSSPQPAPPAAPTSTQNPSNPEEKQSPPQQQTSLEDQDITSIPTYLDEALGNLEDASVRPTIISVGSEWTRHSQASLLAAPKQETLYSDQQDKERDKAFDLLDALTRSGSLPFDDAELHVVIGLTHCFDQSLMDTLIQKSINPIEKLEKTCLIAASVIHQTSPLQLVKDEHSDRIAKQLEHKQ